MAFSDEVNDLGYCSQYGSFCLYQQTGKKLPALVVDLCPLAEVVTDLKIIQRNLFN